MLVKNIPFFVILVLHSTSGLPMNSSSEAKIEEIQHQLLNPKLNSVLLDDSTEAPITKDVFPDRKDFITGHRIPLELFSQETIDSLDTHQAHTANKPNKYVDASNFREVRANET